MIELKVFCDCGQHYKFDVEPVNNRMPFTVACPICGSDGTDKANQTLDRLARLSEPPPGYAGPALPPLPPSPGRPQVRIHSSGPPPVPGHSGGPPPPPGTGSVATVARVVSAPRPLPPGVQAPMQNPVEAAAAPAKPPSFGLGLLGALIGALVGGLIYYLLFMYTGLKFKLIAVAVGYFAGMGAEWMGRKEGSKELGMIAAALALSAIVGAQYFVVKSWWLEGSHDMDGSSYEQVVAQAKAVVKQVPNGTDQEIRVFLAKEYSDDEDKVNAADVPQEDVEEFRETELKDFQQLASGKITKEDYEKMLKQENPNALPSDSGEGDFKAMFMIFFLNRVNIVSIVAAAALAFKLCSNA